MFEFAGSWRLIPDTSMLSDDEVRVRYGPDVVVSRKGEFTLVHLDCPTDEVVEARTADFDPALDFEADCPLCDIQRHQRIYLFDQYSEECEDILLE